MRLLVVGTIACFLVCVCVAGVVRADVASDGSMVVGVSSKVDSRLHLAVIDGGVCYGNITWSCYSPIAGEFVLSVDDVVHTREDWNGSGEVVTNLERSGKMTLAVTLCGVPFSWNVLVINQTAEAWVPEYVKGVLEPGLGAFDQLLLVIKSHAVTIIAMCLPCPLVARWVQSLKDREVHRIV